MSTTYMESNRTDGTWDVTTRVIVYAAIGAALYGVLAFFSFVIPGTANVSVRPAFALVTFFGFAFGPIVGFFTGFVGNAIADQISGWGLLTSWNWSLANGFAGDGAGVDKDRIVEPGLFGFGPHHFRFIGVEPTAEGDDLDAAHFARTPGSSSRVKEPVSGSTLPDHSHSAGPVMTT